MTAETRSAVAGAAIPVPADLAGTDLASVSVLLVGRVLSVKERSYDRRDGTTVTQGSVVLLVGADRTVSVDYPSLAAAQAVAGDSIGEDVMLPVAVSGGWDRSRQPAVQMRPQYRGTGQDWR